MHSNSASFSRRDTAPLVENPYMRSANTIYAGGDRTIFRNQEIARRNAFVLRVMIGICILMTVALVGFTLGKGAGMAEANTTGDATVPVEAPVAHDAEGSVVLV